MSHSVNRHQQFLTIVLEQNFDNKTGGKIYGQNIYHEKNPIIINPPSAAL